MQTNDYQIELLVLDSNIWNHFNSTQISSGCLKFYLQIVRVQIIYI